MAALLILFLSLFTVFTLPTNAVLPYSLITQQLSLLEQTNPILIDHKGTLLKTNYKLHLIFYGHFTSSQRSIVTDFIHSLNSQTSISSWWNTTSYYREGTTTISLGYIILDQNKSLGNSLNKTSILSLASKLPHRNSITAILTASDILVDGFCMSRCGFHDVGKAGKHNKMKYTYLWVGNPGTQCPGECAWPFAKPVYGPQTPPLLPPNGDVGIDGLIITLSTILAGTVTNPFGDGFYQGDELMPLEAVTACTGIFGTGAYAGYPGNVVKDKKTGVSYNGKGVMGREYLVPAMWDPKSKMCKALV